jgi:3-deoxy-D-manno-octulosonate 8-phosphate phosphatase (KDO 8-P phosphatase)
MDPMLREKAARVRLLALDVDGVLTDGKLYFTTDGQEIKAFNSRDGLGLRALMDSGYDVALITGRTSSSLLHRAEQLGIEHVYQGQDKKLAAYEDLIGKLGLSDEQVCYVGDDWIDLPVLNRVGLAVTVADADPEVLQRCHWVTNNRGGNGAVREICHVLLESRGLAQQWLERILAG